MHTRWNLTGDLSVAWSIRKCGRWSRTAVCSSIGMFTRPNEMEPFQIARATSAALQLPLRFEPILEVLTIAAAPLQIPPVCTDADLFFARLRTHGRVARAVPGVRAARVSRLIERGGAAAIR